jgi:hypothetical protein
VVTGSHLDSVPDGGAFDGPLGVVSGFLAIDLLRARGVAPARPLAVTCFTDEEGARFGVACIGSKLLTGALDPDRARALRDDAGSTLAEAMRATGRTALARYAARGKQYLVQLRPIEGGGLVMQQLMYADEVRPFAEFEVPQGEVKPAELELAKQIIEQIAEDEFHPEKYEDDVKKRVLEQIQRKVEGQQIDLTPAEAPPTQVIDLMEALKASLAARGEKAGAEPVAEDRKPAKRAPRGEKEKAAKASRK